MVAPVKAALDASGEDYRILILPDHPTPIRCRTHTSDAVPYLIFDSRYQRRAVGRYDERSAAATGNYEPNGYRLMDTFLNQ